jgi:16S rRNA (adenine1518-N6/adenine1519-N6)-dimethyltransferase
VNGTESLHPRQGQAGGQARGVEAARPERRSNELVTLSFVVSRQRLGQHFLTNASCQRIIRSIFGSAAAAPDDAKSRPSENRPGDVWIEIGAGHGEMTELLAQHARRVVAIEIDERLLPRLCQTAQRLGNVSVVAGDVLALDLAELAPGERFRVYGNLPYYITSPIVHRLLQHADRLDAAFLVMQMEVADRLAARPGHREYAYLSAIVQFYARVEIMLRIPAGAFRPPPKVASALVALRPPGEKPALGIDDERGFGEFLKRCFAQKRKTLRNNLRALVDGESAEQVFRDAGVAPNARAEELTLTQFARLFQLTTGQRRSS